MKKTYRPRNDMVVFRAADRGESEGGVIIPSTSRDGKDFYVVAVGTKVEGLSKDDKVLLAASPEDIGVVPGETDLFCCAEKFLPLVIGHAPGKGE